MKPKSICFGLLLIVSFSISAQKITFQNDIAYLDGNAFVKVIKNSKKKYTLKHRDTNKTLAKIDIDIFFKDIHRRYYKIPKVYFTDSKETYRFRVKIYNRLEVVKLLLDFDLISTSGHINDLKEIYHQSKAVAKL